MKKISAKLWTYGITFFVRAIIFNVALAFAITAIVYVADGMTVWAIIAIAAGGTWASLILLGHMFWMLMSRKERILYFAVRRFGKDKAVVSKKEISRKFGQSDMHSLLSDVDRGLEIQMIINGAFTLLNVFIGFQWLRFALDFHRDTSVFEVQLVD